ncbi:hypothetical protein ACHAWX_007006 [Stephanocyclus meneghinianus]
MNMDEEHGVESVKPKDTAPDAASCSASAPTVAITNGTARNTQNTDSLSALSSDTPEKTRYNKQLSIESIATPEHVHILALEGEDTPQPTAPSSPLTNDSTGASSPILTEQEEVERLRREAARIKREQARLEEEIRLAKLQKDELEQYALAHAQSAAEEDIEIYCENPIEVMSAITEEPRTIVLEKKDVEVMSQITEARTDARHFRESNKNKRRWVAAIIIVIMLAGIAAIVGGVQSRNMKKQSASVASEDVKLVANDAVTSITPTAFPTRDTNVGNVAPVKPDLIDETDDDHVSVTMPSLSVNSDDAETVSPTPSPSVSSDSTPPSFDAIFARTVKIQTNSETILNVFEVEVFNSDGINVAANKNTTQSSTWQGQFASYAVDENQTTYSSTLKENRAWWQVDLEEMTLIESVTIFNFYCIYESDPLECSARLSNSTLLLTDDDDVVVASKQIGYTGGRLELTFYFQPMQSQSGTPSISLASPPPVIPNISPTISPSARPVRLPTIAPIQEPILPPTLAPITQLPSISPPQLICSEEEGDFSVFFTFGEDPTQISWYVFDDCTGNETYSCELCYVNEVHNSSVRHRCLPLARYTFYFSDSAGGVWPYGTGFTVIFNGESQSVQGSGVSLEDQYLTLGGNGSACPTVSPTSQTSAVPTTFDKLPFPYPFPYTRFTPWDMLEDKYIFYAESLGYNSTLWDKPYSYDLEYNVFGSLDSMQQQDVTNLGLSEDQWDCFINHYESYRWDTLPDHALEAAIVLGWSQCVWDKETDCSAGRPASETSNWRQLTPEEKAAGINLCWFRSSWDQSDTLPW